MAELVHWTSLLFGHSQTDQVLIPALDMVTDQVGHEVTPRNKEAVS